MLHNRRQFVTQSLAACTVGVSARASEPVIVFAAASLTEVLQTLAANLTTAAPIRFSFAASSTLARQIEQGAPAQLFISADDAWMDYLVERRHVDAASRRVLAGNRLVVVRHASAAPPQGVLETVPALRNALAPATGSNAPDRVATGDPAHVPAGRYAQAALTRLGLWDDVSRRLVRADNVRSALLFVERGEAAAGIVYATDAPTARGVQVMARFPRASHPPIRYPAALVNGASAAAHEFLLALSSPAAQALWRAAGFEAAQ